MLFLLGEGKSKGKEGVQDIILEMGRWSPGEVRRLVQTHVHDLSCQIAQIFAT